MTAIGKAAPDSAGLHAVDVARAASTMAEDALTWLRDGAAVRAHMGAHALPERVARDGFVRLTSFLPKRVAEGCSAMLANHSDWEAMHYGEVADRSDSVQHQFAFSEPEDHPETLQLIASAVALCFKDLVPSFSVAKYGRGDCIAPHDDKAHVQVEPAGGGPAALHSRKYAAILYLSRGWKAKFGGALLDLEDRIEHVPSFNSMVVFAVPRMHAVAPVLVDRPRLSLFGWWLAPGKLYELDDAAEPEMVEEDTYADVDEIRRAQHAQARDRARAPRRKPHEARAGPRGLTKKARRSGR